MLGHLIVRAAVRTFLFGLWDLRMSGHEHCPPAGPVVVAANHISYLDPPALTSSFLRQIRYMAKVELFASPISNWFFRSLGTFPVDRGHPDRKAIRMALDYLANGEMIGIFPEGQRVWHQPAVPGNMGAALLASRAQAPIVPVGIAGTRLALEGMRWVPGSARVRVVIGPPIPPRPEDQHAGKIRLTAITEELMGAIRVLADRAEQWRTQGTLPPDTK